ncbi:MAG: 3-methyladenine DNA glycosylase [Campylobacteraceae bacterium]|nr:3-methyladenine DNA glycosylase [Campylobacteraceae bacterium]
MLNDSFELLVMLKNTGFLKELRDPLWWPNSSTYEVIVGAILTQQTKWEKVEKSLETLRVANIISLEDISKLDVKTLAILIKKSGFYNTKAKYLLNISKNIMKDFGSFEEFCLGVDRDWLLAQKGIGPESADSILCYGCMREYFVVDNYTAKLLKTYGYEFENYEELAEWMSRGVLKNIKKIEQLYGREISLNEIFARFHGKIVEYGKLKAKK